MCLTKVTSTEKELVEDVGYKIVKSLNVKPEGRFSFIWYPNPNCHDTGKWLERENNCQLVGYSYHGNSQTIVTRPMCDDDMREYPCGFHCFETYEDALQHMYQNVRDLGPLDVIVKVHYRNILARGIQSDVPIIVTEFLKIEPEDLPKL